MQEACRNLKENEISTGVFQKECEKALKFITAVVLAAIYWVLTTVALITSEKRK